MIFIGWKMCRKMSMLNGTKQNSKFFRNYCFFSSLLFETTRIKFVLPYYLIGMLVYGNFVSLVKITVLSKTSRPIFT